MATTARPPRSRLSGATAMVALAVVGLAGLAVGLVTVGALVPGLGSLSARGAAGLQRLDDGSAERVERVLHRTDASGTTTGSAS